MKKFFIVVLGLSLVFIAGFSVFYAKPQKNTEYLRIHIRANSNSSLDQNVKYKVKDEVCEFLTPVLAGCKTLKESEKAIEKSLTKIEEIADKVLKKEGFLYKSKAKIKTENFPTRTYEDLTLNEGYYDALIIYLGEGVGDNWWCVVYPPLCFVNDTTEYRYKSKLVEIINAFFT